jgi:hypothetical protein
VRPVTRESFYLLSQAANREWLGNGAANTPLGMYIGVDLVVESATYVLADPWNTLYEQKKLTPEELQQAIRMYNNIVKQLDLTVRAIKPAGRTSSIEPISAAGADVPLVPDQPAGSNAKLEPLRTT